MVNRGEDEEEEGEGEEEEEKEALERVVDAVNRVGE